MSDGTISYSYDVTGINTDTPRVDTGPLVAFSACEVVGVSNTMALAISSISGKQRLLAADVVSALGNCTQFETVGTHVDTICQQRPDLAPQRTAITETLHQLWRDGILLDADTVKNNLAREVSRQPAPLRVIIISADRPEMLERLLESLLKTSGLSAYNELLIIDDSRSAQNIERNKECLNRFNLRSAKGIRYIGAELQQASIDLLKNALPEAQSAIDFLLSSGHWPTVATYGRARTLGLLFSVGCRAVFLDDDILCTAISAPQPREQLRLGHGGARRAVFHLDQESMLAKVSVLSASPLALHAQQLGQPLSALTRDDSGLDLSHCEAAMALQLRGDAPVIATQCGSWGDPGTSDGHWALKLGTDSLGALVGAGADLRALIEARAGWFGCDGPTVMKNTFMSQMTGVDNSELLPPYFPALRAEDQLFGSMLNALHPHSAVLEFGWGVPHLPPENRGEGSLRGPIPAPGGLGLVARLVDSMVDYSSSESPETRLQQLAMQLRRLGKRPIDDMEIMYRSMLASIHSEQLRQLQALQALTAEQAGPNWRAYLQRALEEIQGALETPVTLANLAPPGSEASREAVYKTLTSAAEDFADALLAWPGMRAQGKQLWALLEASPAL
ncbi:MAG: hypothetical protein ACI87W_000795 [Halieaceae bacterium]|jgi:hypothetical protein